MGATRALLTIRHVNGSTSYVNDKGLAAQYLKDVVMNSNETPSARIADDIENRADITSVTLAAHDLLNKINGQPSHFFGDALRHASSVITPDVTQALSKLQKLANYAKHDWHANGQGQNIGKQEFDKEVKEKKTKANEDSKEQEQQGDTKEVEAKEDMFKTMKSLATENDAATYPKVEAEAVFPVTVINRSREINVTIDAKASHTIEQVKKMLHESCNIPKDLQVLYRMDAIGYAKCLEDDRTLSYYNIRSNAKLRVLTF